MTVRVNLVYVVALGGALGLLFGVWVIEKVHDYIAVSWFDSPQRADFFLGIASVIEIPVFVLVGGIFGYLIHKNIKSGDG